MFGAHFMGLFLNSSSARRRFRDLLGNANHLLVTSLVGLSAVEQRIIVEAPPDLRAAWNPKDQVQSAARTGVLILEMTLVRSTDALDTYIAWARQKPSLVQDPSLSSQLDSDNQSVLKKFLTLSAQYLGLDSKVCALIEVMIAWRNRVVHSLADNEVRPGTWATIEAAKEWIADEFNGMETDRLLADFTKTGPPTFKETASFIRATHKLIEQLDSEFLANLDQPAFLRDLIWKSISRPMDAESLQNARKRLVQSVWGRDSSERSDKLKAFLRSAGLSETRGHEKAAEFSDDLIRELSEIPTGDVIGYLSATA